jgi:hypothetical protein
MPIASWLDVTVRPQTPRAPLVFPERSPHVIWFDAPLASSLSAGVTNIPLERHVSRLSFAFRFQDAALLLLARCWTTSAGAVALFFVGAGVVPALSLDTVKCLVRGPRENVAAILGFHCEDSRKVAVALQRGWLPLINSRPHVTDHLLAEENGSWSGAARSLSTLTASSYRDAIGGYLVNFPFARRLAAIGGMRAST